MRRIRPPRSRPRPRTSRGAIGAARVALFGALGLVLLLAVTGDAWAAAGAASTAGPPWWVWSIGLFLACCLLGIVAVPAGIGGGTLFVPIVGSFFPFHLDYVRGAGLLVALASALSAGPVLLRGGLASVRLALPLGLLASLSAIGGALVGMALSPALVQTLLGGVVLGIVTLMLVLRQGDVPSAGPPDALALRLGLQGQYLDGASGRPVAWQARRTVAGLGLFVLIGFLGGLFGIGAGWANVPVLNLLMGLPLKVAAGTSGLVLSLASGSAVWVYLNQGAILPLIALPAVLGMMIGARIGARLLHVLSGAVLRRLVIGVLLFAGLRALLRGTGVWS